MKPKTIINTILLLFVAVSVAYLAFKPKTPLNTSTKNEVQTISTGTVVYYFHSTKRCDTCIKFQKYTREVLKDKFTPQINKKSLQFKVINRSDSQNTNFVKKYNLVSNSIVLVSYQNGKAGTYKNLDQIWQLVKDEKMFKNYITTEVQTFIGG